MKISPFLANLRSRNCNPKTVTDYESDLKNREGFLKGSICVSLRSSPRRSTSSWSGSVPGTIAQPGPRDWRRRPSAADYIAFRATFIFYERGRITRSPIRSRCSTESDGHERCPSRYLGRLLKSPWK